MYKLFLIIIFGVGSFLPGDSRAETSLAVSLPHGFELAYAQTLGNESPWSLRVGVGGWPIERAWPASLTRSNELDETYAMDFAPRAFLLASSVKALYRWSPESNWRISGGLDFWTLDVGALVYVRNRATGESVMVSQIDGRWWQPLLSVGASWTFARRQEARWDLDFGLSARIGGALNFDVQGSLPALNRVAPEFADAMDDGVLQAQTDLSRVIRDAMSKLLVLPTVGVRYVW